MSAEQNEIAVDERIERLERKAAVLRSRLLRRVDALDARRHRVEAIGEQAKALAKPAALGALGIAASVSVGALLIRQVVRARRKNRFTERVAAFVRELDLVRAPSLGQRVVEKLAMSVGVLLATEVLKHGLPELVATGTPATSRAAAQPRHS